VHNPSIISFNSKLYMTFRCQGHRSDKVTAWYAETFFTEVDSELNVISEPYPLIADRNVTHEDARLSVRGDRLFVSYVSDVSYKHGDYRTCTETGIFLPGEQVIDTIRPDINNNKIKETCMQKNWLFFERDTRFLSIYSIDPMTVWDVTDNLEYPTKICEKSKVMDKWSYGQPRSSTTPIYLNQYDRWITFFHSHLFTAEPIGSIRMYFIGALLFDNDFNIRGYTDLPLLVSTPTPKRSLGANTVLPYGCLLQGDQFIMTLGINDIRAGVGRLPLDKVMSHINPI